MKGGENLGPIPNDLINEILSRLPAKSVGRFRCVSKIWGSMLHHPYFTELFLNRSRARPRLLLAVEQSGVWSLYSLPQPHSPYGKSSSPVATADFHMKFPGEMHGYTCRYASGLINIFPDTWISKEPLGVICNPITGQYASLPKLTTDRVSTRFLGFDLIDKQLKVLFKCDDHYRILTLGTREGKWRKIPRPFTRGPSPPKEICINGVLYYLVYKGYKFCRPPRVRAIGCFDIRSEKLKFISGKSFGRSLGFKLINYKGKFSGIACKDNGRILELRLLVLEDVEKQEWSKHVYTLPENDKFVNLCGLYVVGVTAKGEIVLSMELTCASEPFYVFYFSPESNTLQTVQIQGLRANLKPIENPGRVYAFVDHVEDLNLNDANLLKSSIFAPSMKKKPRPQHQEEVREREEETQREKRKRHKGR